MKLFGLNIERVRNANRRAVTNDTPVVPASGGVALTWGQLLRSQHGLDIPTFYRCVEMISGSIAQMPIEVLDKKRKQVAHALDEVFEEPTNLLTKYELMHQLMQSTLLNGNGFMHIERASDGHVVGLRWLESTHVSIYYVPTINKLAYECVDVGTGLIDPMDMVHLKFMSYDGINGQGADKIGSKAIGLARATDDAARAYFDNNCNINGIIAVHSAINEKQRADIKETWKDTYTTKGGGIAVLGGNMDFQPVSSKPNDSQMVESRQQNTLEVCRLFGINPVLVGCNTGATFSNFETAQNEFVVRTLMPYTAMIEAEFTKKLLTSRDKGRRVCLDESCLLRADKAAESSYYTQLCTNGILTINEARQQLGYEPVKGGDDIRIPFSDANQNKVAGNDEGNDKGGKKDDGNTQAGGTAEGDNNNNPKNSQNE